MPDAYPDVNYICLGENTMDKKIYDTYVRILEEELVPALGCTEPIALAYAAAKAGEVLGTFPEHLTVACSGNIIKNVKGVTVPNSGGMKGVEAAAVLGLTGGDPGQALEVLETVKESDIIRTKELIQNGFCDCVLKEGVANLYIEAKAVCKEEEAIVVIEDEHTNITRIEKNGRVLFEKEEAEIQAAEITDDETPDKNLLNLEDIIAFANEVRMEDVENVLGRQVKYNTRIAEEGLKNPWGAQVGRVVLEEFGGDVKWRAVAKAAAGSDARMSGCSLPVIINSGSGNQGMTCSLPVIEYGHAMEKAEEEGIPCEYQVDLEEVLPIDDIDLCSLFANTLDNAVEACEKIAEREKRRISLKARCRNGHFSYEIVNSKENRVTEKNGNFETDKSDRLSHGIGLRNVRQIVRKYEGEMDVSYTEDTFSVTIFV